MVQSSHKKATRPKRLGWGKSHGKPADLTQFCSQLDALGLKVVEVTSDGNCFFRALADQLEGDEGKHNRYRHMVVEYIVNHREEFEPFIEDEVPFDEYCKTMEEDGTWAGNMELQAASLVTQSNICIHRLLSPRWYIQNFASNDARMIHLSYHDGEHYNSVRLKEDPCSGPAKRITIKVDTNIARASDQAKSVGKKSKAISSRSIVNEGAVKLVMLGTGCEDYSKAKEILKEVDGDVDAAIEYLIAERRMIEDANTNDNPSCIGAISHEHENDRSKQCVNGSHVNAESCISDTISEMTTDVDVNHDEEVMRQKGAPPQGSKKKQKMNELVSTSKRSMSSSTIHNKSNVGKGKKDKRKNLKKGSAYDVIDSSLDQREIPDVGALCI